MPDPYQFPAPETAVHLADQHEATMAALGRQYAAFYRALVEGKVPLRVAATMVHRQHSANLSAWLGAQAG